jgi:glycosyltransferase involved in cell wall biosynthesis
VKIAQVSPLFESVPPKLYGGTERIVSYLTEELVRRGHEVTLFASGDSQTAAQLVPGCPRALRLDPACVDQLVHHLVMLEKVYQLAAEFDVIHFHSGYLHFPLSRAYRARDLTTLHGRLDIADLEPIYREFSKAPLVSISDAQRLPLPWAGWLGTVYHGLPQDLYAFQPKTGKYLAFLGRIAAEKRPDRAIRIAQRAGLPLKIAAKVDPADRAYYQDQIKPMIDQAGSSVEFIGEVGEKEKNEFLGNALALLFPIDWPEPFGLVMIEAMACGTPVIAYRNGSVPEVMVDGVTGFVVDNLNQAVQAVERVPGLSRAGCRRAFEERFTVPRMARDYVRIYEAVVSQGPRGADGSARPARSASRVLASRVRARSEPRRLEPRADTSRTGDPVANARP